MPKSDRKEDLSFCTPRGSTYDSEDKACHGQGEAAEMFHRDACGVSISSSIGFLCQKEFADRHFQYKKSLFSFGISSGDCA